MTPGQRTAAIEASIERNLKFARELAKISAKRPPRKGTFHPVATTKVGKQP